MSNLSYNDYCNMYGTDYKGNKVNLTYCLGVTILVLLLTGINLTPLMLRQSEAIEISLYISKYF